MATLANPTEVAENVGHRLEAATVAHRDAQEVATKVAAAWKKLIVEAIEAGMPYQTVADITGVSRARIHHVLVSEYSTA